VTMVYSRWLDVTNGTIVALTFLLIVLVVAATSKLWIAVSTSLAAMVCFNFFFLPPVGTLTIADPENWVALFTFLAVSLVASNLSSAVRARAQEALDRRDEMARRAAAEQLAESLGATVVRVKAERPAEGLIAFAQREGITHVIFGQSARSRWELLWRGSTIERFLSSVRDAAVQGVPLPEQRA
jgi:K+-sensing histidine kinase KdpD